MRAGGGALARARAGDGRRAGHGERARDRLRLLPAGRREHEAYRVRVRPPCFAIMSALSKLLTGDMIADIVPTFGAVNMIGGELDR